jgi:hypothetical protein
MVTIDKAGLKRIESLKKKVGRVYPNVKLHKSANGYCKLIYEDANGSEINLLSEYFMPPTKNPLEAWEQAATTARVTQNFNRTHPYRVEVVDIDSKLNSIGKRRHKAKVNDETRVSKSKK